MIVIAEGPDNAGKTTLISHLAKHFEGLLFRDFRFPRSQTDFQSHLNTCNYLSQHRTVFSDRINCLSEPIYGTILRGSSVITQVEGIELLSSLRDLILIYCCPPKEVALSFKVDIPQLAGVIEASERIYEAYISLFERDLPATVIKYDYTDPPSLNKLIHLLQL